MLNVAYNNLKHRMNNANHKINTIVEVRNVCTADNICTAVIWIWLFERAHQILNSNSGFDVRGFRRYSRTPMTVRVVILRSVLEYFCIKFVNSPLNMYTKHKTSKEK